MELKLLKRYSITIKYANLIFYLNFKAYSGVGKAAHCQLGVPCSVPAHATNFYTSTPVIEITTTIVDHISCMWSKVDNFSCYFSTNSRENFTTNLLVFRTREISKGVVGIFQDLMGSNRRLWIWFEDSINQDKSIKTPGSRCERVIVDVGGMKPTKSVLMK